MIKDKCFQSNVTLKCWIWKKNGRNDITGNGTNSKSPESRQDTTNLLEACSGKAFMEQILLQWKAFMEQILLQRKSIHEAKYYCRGKAFMKQCRTEVFYFLQHKTRFHASENYFSLWKICFKRSFCEWF